MQLGHTLLKVLCGSDADCMRPCRASIQTVSGHAQPRYRFHRSPHSPDTHSNGPYSASMQIIRDPKRVRYTQYGILYSSEPGCIGSCTDPIHAVLDHIQIRRRPYRALYSPDTHTMGHHTQLRCTRDLILYGSDTHCMGSSAVPILFVRVPVRRRYRLPGVLHKPNTHSIRPYTDQMQNVLAST